MFVVLLSLLIYALTKDAILHGRKGHEKDITICNLAETEYLTECHPLVAENIALLRAQLHEMLLNVSENSVSENTYYMLMWYVHKLSVKDLFIYVTLDGCST